MRQWLLRCPLTDSQQIRRWHILNLLLLGFIGLDLVSLVPNLWAGTFTLVPLVLISSALLGIIYAINHRGAVEVAAISVTLFLLVIIAYVVSAPGDSVVSAFIMTALFVIPIVLSGAILPWQTVPLVTTVALALVGWIYTAGSQPISSYLAANSNDIVTVGLSTSFLLVIMGSATMLSSRQIAQTLLRLEEQNRDLAAANGDLQTQGEREHQLGTDIQHLSGQLQAVTIRQVQSTNVQAYSISQVVSSVSELHQAADQIAQLARQVRGAAAEALANVERSQELVLQSRVAIERNQTQVNEVISHMTTLNRVTTRITTFIDAIRDLSDETHLLALNAAIEAAGAGTMGRRFGVVADEVQNLAGRSTAIVDEIQALIGELYAAGRQTLAATQHSDVVAREMVALADQVRGVQGTVLATVHSTNALVNQISVATGQQTSATQQVTTIMQQLAQVADSTTHDTATLQQAISDLGRAAERLTQVMA